MQRVSGVSVDAPPFALGLPGSTTAAVLVQQGAAVARLQLLAVADGGQQCLAASLEVRLPVLSQSGDSLSFFGEQLC